MKKCAKLITLMILAVLSTAGFAAIPEVLKQQYGPIDSDPVLNIIAPSIAGDGGNVSVMLKQAKALAANEYIYDIKLFATYKHDIPLASLRFGDRALVDGTKVRIRLRETTHVYAVAMLNTGRVIVAEKEIKVTRGGCGNAG